jgi:hypothetical protein
MTGDRDGRGRFAAGNRGGPGRPRRATEAEYLRALSHIVSVEDLRAIARRAVADAKKGSARARDWVSRYLLGDPVPKAPSGTGRKRNYEALLRSIHEALSQEPAAAGPPLGGCPPEDRAPGGPGAPAPAEPAPAFPNEEKR